MAGRHPLPAGGLERQAQTETVLRTLRDLGHRADLDQREAGFLRAIAIEVVKYVRRLEGR